MRKVQLCKMNYFQILGVWDGNWTYVVVIQENPVYRTKEFPTLEGAMSYCNQDESRRKRRRRSKLSWMEITSRAQDIRRRYGIDTDTVSV